MCTKSIVRVVDTSSWHTDSKALNQATGQQGRYNWQIRSKFRPIRSFRTARFIGIRGAPERGRLNQTSGFTKKQLADSGVRHHERRLLGSDPQLLPRAEKKEAPYKSAETDKAVLTLPTLLTISRVAEIPILIAVWFSNLSSAATLAGLIFLVACITDFLDGYLARKMGSFSAFGAFLDPVADKLIVSTALILLSSKPIAAGTFSGNAWLLPTLASAIIGREIAMSALREWAATAGEEAHKAAAVSKLGKWKTTTQMVSLTLLLLTSSGHEGWLVDVGVALLCIATFLTLFSLYEYLRGLWKYLF